MEFLDEESRPRLMFQSRPLPSTPDPESLTLTPHKPTLIISLLLSSFLFTLSFLYLQSEPFKSLILWLALSFLVGPFAPSSLTAGDIRVGVGPALPPPSSQNDQSDPADSSKKPSNRRSKARKPEEFGQHPAPVVVNEPIKSEERKGSEPKPVILGEEREWSDGDLDLLKKQLVKYPVGMPGRWEAITLAFSGRHLVESVIREAKSMGERKGSDTDSFTRFLKDRKPVDKRIDGGNEGGDDTGAVENGGVSWSAGEDIALLNALKAFPKDVAMRWEKIVAAVPGKSKAACMKRLAELKKNFRSSKATADS
ncbi:hypothetical protein RJ639_008296 [Escallonia herrerae]|uniref:Myb-like domain-containing protein n=1 Tax=Escallonia herrerae TaxID=1293975 RepID=A0AA89ATR5_9ASTE|nr:hypothetical protein RJ639_008296 [Escallonia herrerae]